MFYRANKRQPSPYFKGYEDDYTIPDQGLTIGDMIERHLDSGAVSNHSHEVMEDTNIDEPMRYDSDLTDVKTIYQDKEYFDDLAAKRTHISQGAIDYNPKNLNPNEKVPASPSQSLPSDSPVSQGS